MVDVNRDEIKKEAKEIMDNFMNSLKDIEIETDFKFIKEESYRKELNDKKELDEDFKQRFLSNAPKIKGDAILTVKGKWVKN